MEDDPLRHSGVGMNDQKIKALHIYIDKLDMPMAKPLLMQLYVSKTAEDHEFPIRYLHATCPS